MVASLTWPYTLPPSWSVEWDTTPANDDNNVWCHVRALSWCLYRRLELSFIFRCKSELWTTLCLKFKYFAESQIWFIIFPLCSSSAAKPNSVVLADFQNLLNYLLCYLNSVCNIFRYTTLLCKKWCNIVISGPAFVWTMFALSILKVMWFLSGFYPRDCRDEPSEVRVKPHLPLRWWLAHLNWFCRAVLPHSPDH